MSGGWVIEETKGPVTDILADGDLVVATVYADTYDGDVMPRARLIAAAPELLEALKFMTRHRELQLSMSGATRKAEDVEMAKAAIAKAEGTE